MLWAENKPDVWFGLEGPTDCLGVMKFGPVMSGGSNGFLLALGLEDCPELPDLSFVFR